MGSWKLRWNNIVADVRVMFDKFNPQDKHLLIVTWCLMAQELNACVSKCKVDLFDFKWCCILLMFYVGQFGDVSCVNMFLHIIMFVKRLTNYIEHYINCWNELIHCWCTTTLCELCIHNNNNNNNNNIKNLYSLL